MGEYKTKKRELILEYLLQNKDTSVTVKDIEYFLAKNTDVKPNITTIYRYLEKLMADGCLMCSEEAGKKYYQYIAPDNTCKRHLHMKCTGCGKVLHMNCDFMDEFEKHIKGDHGFTINYKNSMIFGVCESCKAENKIY